jgi:hypothetical protein
MNLRAAFASFGALASVAASAPPHLAGAGTGAAIAEIEVVGTEFRGTLIDGRVLAGTDLVGAVLTVGDGANQARIRIDAVQADPKDPSGEITLYAFSSLARAAGVWRNLCSPDPDGVAMGFPLSGVWTPSGEHQRSARRFSLTCTSDVSGKCVRMGYKPWKTTAEGTSLWPYHQACTRMMRADYCGDGTPHTRNGTLVNVSDRLGIHPFDPEPPLTFEAAWGVGGAVCVRHVRIPDVVSLEDLVRACPNRLAGKVGQACTEQAASRAPDTMVLNQSHPAGPTP